MAEQINQQKIQRLEDQVERLTNAVIVLLEKIDTLDRDRLDIWHYIGTKK